MEIKHIRTILVILFIGAIVYFLPNIISMVEESGVKGASAERAKEVSGNVGKSISTQTDILKKQVLNIKVSDIIDGASKVSKISQDIKNGQKYLKEQLDNVIKSKK